MNSSRYEWNRSTNVRAQGRPINEIVDVGKAARNARKAGTAHSRSPKWSARKMAIVRGYVNERRARMQSPA